MHRPLTPSAWIPKDHILEFDENYAKHAASPATPKLFQRALEEVDYERKGIPIPVSPKRKQRAEPKANAGGKAGGNAKLTSLQGKATPKRKATAKEKAQKTAEEIIKESGLLDLNDEAPTTPPKRGRGRPPKKKLPPKTVATPKTLPAAPKRALSSDKEVAVPAKRGRKPKPKPKPAAPEENTPARASNKSNAEARVNNSPAPSILTRSSSWPRTIKTKRPRRGQR